MGSFVFMKLSNFGYRKKLQYIHSLTFVKDTGWRSIVRPSCIKAAVNENLRTKTAPENLNLLDTWHYVCSSLQFACLRARNFGDKSQIVTEMSEKVNTSSAFALLPSLSPANAFNAVHSQPQTSRFSWDAFRTSTVSPASLAQLSSSVMSRYRISWTSLADGEISYFL
jgi:hypothetical protein